MKNQHLSQTRNALASSNREGAISRYSPHPIEKLQGALGNQAVHQLLASQPRLQTKPMFRGLSEELRSPSPLQAQLAKNADSASVSEVQPENKTGLPDNLKVGIENLSGIAIDDVRVHKNSSKPSQLQALAYIQGIDIHVAPGQETHLPHEAWHVVQQKQGRVKPTIQAKGVGINDDPGLEKEADVMGSKAVQMESDESTLEFLDNSPEANVTGTLSGIQCKGSQKSEEVIQRVESVSKIRKEFEKLEEKNRQEREEKKKNEEKREANRKYWQKRKASSKLARLAPQSLSIEDLYKINVYRGIWRGKA